MIYHYHRLKKNIESLGKTIDAPAEQYPHLGVVTQDAHPCIIRKSGRYYLIASENGIVLSENEYTDIQSLLFDVFEKITFNMAMQYELHHRNSGEDFRRVLFSYQLELMKKLSEEWENSLKVKINDILLENPYVD